MSAPTSLRLCEPTPDVGSHNVDEFKLDVIIGFRKYSDTKVNAALRSVPLSEKS
jgi:hypothetical protein